MRKRDLHGSWMVVEHRYFNQVDDPIQYCCIVGALFNLHKDGDVVWQPHPESDKLPFMKSEFFMLSKKLQKCHLKFLVENGQNLEFEVKLSKDRSLMELVYSTLLQLKCVRVLEITRDRTESPFLDSLQSGEFSDMAIIAKNGEHFRCHKCILSCMMPEANLDDENFILLFSRNAKVIGTLLHYIYAGFLPIDMTAERAKKALKFAKNKPELKVICDKLQEFLDQTGAKDRITSTVDDIEILLNKVCKLVEETLASCSTQNKLFEDLGKFVYACKEVIRELCVAALKLLLFCDLFSKFKKIFSKQERDDILKRITEIFFSQAKDIRNILKEAREKFEAVIVEEDFFDLAVYILPEVEDVLQLISFLKNETLTAMKKIINDEKESSTNRRKKQKGPRHIWKMKNMAHLKELITMKKLLEEMTTGLENISCKSEELKSLSQAERISKAIDYLREFLRTAVVGGQWLSDAIDEIGPEKKTKIYIRLAMSLLTRPLEIARAQQSSLSFIIKTISGEIASDSFDQTLQQLGFLTHNQSPGDAFPYPECSSAEGEPKTAVANKAFAKDSSTNATRDVENHLSKSLSNLLESGKYADMEFLVSSQTDEGKPEMVVKAHRVVVASRCKWFSRALRSGMRESTERKFYIKDCSPDVFKIFLQYLYDGTVKNSENLSEEQLADLITLADRYETEKLLHVCEELLTNLLNEKNVLMILSFADILGAQKLKVGALTYITHCNKPLNVVDIAKLSDNVRDEVQSLMKLKEQAKKKLHTKTDEHSVSDVLPETVSRSRSNSSSSNESLSSNNFEENSDASSSDNSQTETPDLSCCIEGLRNILGPEVPNSELMQIALNADCDLNRAINDYFQ